MGARCTYWEKNLNLALWQSSQQWSEHRRVWPMFHVVERKCMHGKLAKLSGSYRIDFSVLISKGRFYNIKIKFCSAAVFLETLSSCTLPCSWRAPYERHNTPCLGRGLNTEPIQGHLDTAGGLKGQCLCLPGKIELPAVQVKGMLK